MNSKILYIEGCDYIDFPIGGQLTFAKQMLNAFGNELALVGLVTEQFPIGSWQKRNINGIEYDFFALFHATKTANKPLIPRRLRVMIALLKYKKKIKEVEADLVVTRSPEVIIPISRWTFPKICYYFAGTGNPLEISRRSYGRIMAKFYDRIFFPSLKKISIILAAADKTNIIDTVKRSNGILSQQNINIFPTRIDTAIFKPMKKEECRKKLGIHKDKITITTTGRLHWAKGWKLLIDAYMHFLKEKPNSHLYFIGDGNERASIELYLKENNIAHLVSLQGFKSHEVIAEYINASDLYIMGSLMEGWATSLLEAKACGTPICTTNFSSATSIVKDGIDGYVILNRNPLDFAKKMLYSLELKIDTMQLEVEMQKYSIDNLRIDFIKACNLK